MMIEAPTIPLEKVLEPQSPIDIIQGVLDGLEKEGAEPVTIQVEGEEEEIRQLWQSTKSKCTKARGLNANESATNP